LVIRNELIRRFICSCEFSAVWVHSIENIKFYKGLVDYYFISERSAIKVFPAISVI